MPTAKRKNSPVIKTALEKLIQENSTVFHKGRHFTSSQFLLDTWKDKKRNWGHSMHTMASRSGSFPPALANYFITNFSKKGDKVLDPFSGKGTTALEACLNNRYGIGVDVAPEAFALTCAKTNSVDHDEAVTYLNELELETISKKEIDEVKDEVKVFYHDNVLKQILAFRKAIEKDFSFKKDKVRAIDSKNRAKFAKYWTGVIIGILHGSSETSLSVSCSHSYSMAPNYVKNYSKKHGLEKPDRGLKECLIKRSQKLLSDGALKYEGLSLLTSAMDMPFENDIDLIVTSPPYFTAQSYAWDNWLREWYLGYDFKEVRKDTLHTSVEDKYRIAMREHLEEAYRSLKSKRWAFYVVGDVIKKVKAGAYKIITAEIIAQEAQEVGFSVELIINDNIPETSRYNSAFLKKDQGLKLDRIVCLYKN